METSDAYRAGRNLAELRGYDWDGDPEPWLPSFTWGRFRPAEGLINVG